MNCMSTLYKVYMYMDVLKLCVCMYMHVKKMCIYNCILVGLRTRIRTCTCTFTCTCVCT